MGNLRLVLDELQDRRPALVRGNSGYGNAGILLELKSRAQPYLLRLHQTANVQRLVAQQFSRHDWGSPGQPGLSDGGEAQLQLYGWSAKRRVVIVRQQLYSRGRAQPASGKNRSAQRR